MTGDVTPGGTPACQAAGCPVTVWCAGLDRNDTRCGSTMTMTEVPVLFLDLDGTVRQGRDDPLGRFVNGPEDVVVWPEAVNAMDMWRAHGGRVVAITNQGGIELGHMTLETCIAALQETHRQTGGLFDQIMYCRHYNEPCWCRKPMTGMLSAAVTILHGRYPDETYPHESMMFVGDREEDAKCAANAGIEFMEAQTWRSVYGV